MSKKGFLPQCIERIDRKAVPVVRQGIKIAVDIDKHLLLHPCFGQLEITHDISFVNLTHVAKRCAIRRLGVAKGQVAVSYLKVVAVIPAYDSMLVANVIFSILVGH